MTAPVTTHISQGDPGQTVHVREPNTDSMHAPVDSAGAGNRVVWVWGQGTDSPEHSDVGGRRADSLGGCMAYLLGAWGQGRAGGAGLARVCTGCKDCRWAMSCSIAHVAKG